MKVLIGEFEVILSNDLPIGLPWIRSISHQIDLIPGSSLSKKAPHRIPPIESEEINRQV